jgi:ATP-dependent Clp protease ATP-binding subunit ClpA
VFERFTDRARRTVVFAQEEARLLNHNYIGTEHILLGLIREGEGVAAQVLQKLGADLNRVRQTVVQLLSGYRAGAEVTGVEGAAEMAELTSEMAISQEPLGDDAPTCPNCFGALDETLAVRVLETTADGEDLSVKIAYCSRCGVALGVAP